MDPFNAWLPRLDELVEEAALSVNINGINHAVMMVTPDDLDDFAIGFLFGDGIIAGNQDVHDIQITPSEQGMVLDVTIANRCLAALSQRKRRLTGATGCGICGVEAIEHALPALTPLAPLAPPAAVSLANLRERIAPWQCKARQSGALHAALALDEQGEIVACREDIGRHNALDKLIGMQLRRPVRASTLVITSRCGSELIHKAVQFGAAHLISLASPSQLAVRLALKYNLNLIHVPRFDAPVYYSHGRPSDQIGEPNVQSY
ncbi:formate dehydrogenase accessory sulfurtransferase FdhD [Aeromonas encheleia]|uniref:formate dehydrogenase accessory sulfurtransferase FdhD n=1 Tax=Aeromonas encheleia TaxID=73010 RepID=UPI001F5AE6F1|nr:formate dehydrogenase accessory sulfurtransferase FdhD [Aeromonas encheleia]UNP90262.1 formate dehydrogenase accessory sulfurtransferase FdhD [Aeromonas encheleia]